MLKNFYLLVLAKIGVDTAENELPKFWRPKLHSFNPVLDLDHLVRDARPRQQRERLGGKRREPVGEDHHAVRLHEALDLRAGVRQRRVVHAEGGLRAFYSGLGLKLLRAVPMSAIGFFAYERTMAILARRH